MNSMDCMVHAYSDLDTRSPRLKFNKLILLQRNIACNATKSSIKYRRETG